MVHRAAMAVGLLVMKIAISTELPQQGKTARAVATVVQAAEVIKLKVLQAVAHVLE